MGALLGEARKLPGGNGASLATKALSNFSIGVPDIVGQHNGVTIYAGGDDVLAMLPLDCALKCASQLAKAYQAEFTSKIGAEAAKQATLSGAVVYAHYHVPLRDVLKTAHHMLDDVAKDATGRDSLAIAVFKSSGITAQWSAPWEHIRDVGVAAKSDNIVDALRIELGGQPLTSCDLAESLSDSKPGHGVAEQRSAEFSSGFLYNVRERFAALTDKALTRPGEFGRLSQELCDNGNDLFKSVLVADYLRGKQKREAEGGTAEERHEERLSFAKAAIDLLLKLSQRVTRFRLEGSSPPKFKLKHHPDTLGIDGALVVRFLANDGKEDAE